MNETTYVSQEGLEKLKQELDGLKTVKRREIATRIQEAKELGDLSENAEYAEAKDEQAFIEGRILEIENILKNATLIEAQGSTSTVRVGSTVDVDVDGKKLTYTIVGSNEVDPANGKVSNESPLGKALLGCRVGEVATMNLAIGDRAYRVERIR